MQGPYIYIGVKLNIFTNSGPRFDDTGLHTAAAESRLLQTSTVLNTWGLAWAVTCQALYVKRKPKFKDLSYSREENWSCAKELD